MNTKLWNLQENTQATVTDFGQDIPEELKVRLMELGLQKSGSIICLRKAPFNGPSTYQVGDGVISLDKDITKNISIRS
jgi:Fe2+ transport system protein FeoA